MTSDQIKQEFIRARVEGAPLSLRELALRHGRSHASLRQAASRGRWTEVAAIACGERDAAIAAKITERNALTEALLGNSVEHRVQVLERHARLARSLQEVALNRLLTLGSGELSAKLAIELLRTGLEAERAALRLDDVDEQQTRDFDAERSQLREAFRNTAAILQKYRPRLPSEPTLGGERAINGSPGDRVQSSAPARAD